MQIVPPGNTRSSSSRAHQMFSHRLFPYTLILILLFVCIFQRDGMDSSSDGNILYSPLKKRTGSNASNIFRGKQYWKDGVTQSVQTLYETPFARFQIHQVKLQTSGPIIQDWLWFDEADNVNILVQDEAEGRFWILEQTKYAFGGGLGGKVGDDSKSYAVVGGLIELDKGESPLQAAKRELKEELKLEANDWVSLGNYVAAANRGGGTTHVFWARKARPLSGSNFDQRNPDEIAEGELERQDLVKLSREELLEALESGRFREIKWTATVALALLREQSCQHR